MPIHGFIYKISSKNTPRIYIGSTSRHPMIRLYEHRTKFRLHRKGQYNYVTSFEIIQHEDHKMEILEESDYGSIEEMYLREHELISMNDCCNTALPLRNEIHHCVCGGHYTRPTKSTHHRSIRHMKYLEKNPVE